MSRTPHRLTVRASSWLGGAIAALQLAHKHVDAARDVSLPEVAMTGARTTRRSTAPLASPAAPHLALARRVAAAVGITILAWGVLGLCAATVPAAWGWRPNVVASGSMEPAISVGDVVLVASSRPNQLRPGDVILADVAGQPGRTYLHRVVRIEGGKVVTRGDANQSEDSTALAFADVKGETRLVVPVVGWPLLWLEQPSPHRVAAAVVTALVIVAACVMARPAWGATRRRGVRARRRHGSMPGRRRSPLRA